MMLFRFPNSDSSHLRRCSRRIRLPSDGRVASPVVSYCMEFLAIIGIGAVLAILVVIGNRPKRPRYVRRGVSQLPQLVSTAIPIWKKGTAQSHPIGELEYLEGIERNSSDAEHQPFPLPPPIQREK